MNDDPMKTVAEAAKSTLDYSQPDSLGGERSETRLQNIWGYFKRVTGVPTYIPVNTDSTLALHTDKAQIDYYDDTNNQWRSIGSSGSASYGGSVASDAGSNTLPSGWSASVNTTTYTITHNLGTTAYAVAFSVASYSLKDVLQTRGANSFSVDFENSSGTAFATAFDFILIPIV